MKKWLNRVLILIAFICIPWSINELFKISYEAFIYAWLLFISIDLLGRRLKYEKEE